MSTVAPGRPEQPYSGLTIAVFATAPSAVGFVAAVAASGGQRMATCHRAPDGTYCVIAEIETEIGAELAWAAAGQPYAVDGDELRPVAGGPDPGSRLQADVSTVAEWPVIEVAELIARCRPSSEQPVPVAAAEVLTSGPLSRHVLLRCLQAGQRVDYQAVRHHPLEGGPYLAGLRIRMAAIRGTLPQALLLALAALSATVVCRPCGPDGRLLLDLRYRLPIDEVSLAMTVPDGQTWAIGGPEFGTRLVVPCGSWTDAATLLTAEVIPAPLDQPDFASAARLAPIRVRVVASSSPGGRTDARLLEDSQLGLLRTFLAYRPTVAGGLLLLGDGWHLLTEPAGLVADVPFGIPMRRVSPHPLFVEAGCDLMPPLHPAASARVFGADGVRAVAAWRGGAAAFLLEHAVPVWSLWLADPGDVRSDVSEYGWELLSRAAAWLGDGEGQTVPVPPAQSGSDPFEQATRLELAGRFAEAAMVMEETGQMLPAGRLWLMAAAQEEGSAGFPGEPS